LFQKHFRDNAKEKTALDMAKLNLFYGDISDHEKKAIVEFLSTAKTQ
jgi:hypothetical protein